MFVITHGFQPRPTRYESISILFVSPRIELQADTSQFGRGEYHLSASLVEGDVVVYRTGTWAVDGVTVGDGSLPEFKYAKVEAIQLVWTHNCEHGVLRGLLLTNNGQQLCLTDPLQDVQFGPDQLVAKLPVVWDGQRGRSLLPVDDSMWVALE